MSNAKHTPGPWAYTPAIGRWASENAGTIDASHYSKPGCFDGRDSVATVHNSASPDMAAANAALIAAAPDLLAALEQARARLWIMYQEDDNASPPILDLVDAAIAKATLDNS